ncbi:MULTISPECIES: TIGR02302 family protein [Marivita]|uniref:TIGR02302 family protein n=1 Tax=Marivita cryptomonadis TaxID=505252 RepID=A0A9Q2NV34_9RHOB|nr:MULTISPECIES: TIGR02302 family protein [Marivita]MCR9167592.1 TIGR02302 family protein [Paracoccaceae bacterium]MBM2321973.1 TIGR02302 family protein [Marivita cryptomonadis]MBM2331400.1 TIGR02302 family protein [Marivita cryptomonadis]MBM2340986.1 TIGR02302 family protein [Marivita cryptomonadis]MBM2345648.1 TIGR02302 family protein [Marivita cryptomonadis]
MTAREDLPKEIDAALRWPLFLTRLGMGAEVIVRAFWPLWSVLFAVLAFLMLGLQDYLPMEAVWVVLAVSGLAAAWALVRGVRRFSWPSQASALARLDATLPGNPILAAMDSQAIGASDPASLAVWNAHQARMAARLKDAKAAEPDLRVSKADPFALRYVAVLAFLVAAVFGSVLKVQTVSAMGPSGSDLASGPTWEGWLEPPHYTGRPSIYLNDIRDARLDTPEGSRVTLRFYGEVGVLSVTESVSNRTAPIATPEDLVEASTNTAQEFTVTRSGQLAIEGPGGRAWEIVATPDRAPEVMRDGEIEVSYEGEAQIPFTANDDYAVATGTARIALALTDVDRRYGLRIDPEPRATIELPLPMPIAGDRSEFTETLVDNFSEHPWANLPVTISLTVTDEAEQIGEAVPEVIDLPGRRFFDPMASSIIDLRRSLLWNRDNAADVALLMRAVSHRPDDVFRSSTDFLRLRTIMRRIEALSRVTMTDDQQAEIAQAMWDLAIRLEEGDLEDALERLQRAQDRLSEAMRNGASDQEIAELMQELREATDDYLRQLSRQAQQDQQNDPDQEMTQNQNMMEMSQNDLQEMMDRIQELMEQGRMAEAQEALEQLRQMMENMQVTQGQGQQGQSPGEQAMEGLAETLREQQGLSDQAFRDLQEQFNPGQQGQQGQQPGQQPGQQGQGQGQQQGQQQGQGQQPGQGGQNGEGQSLEDSLAERQRSLRQELNRQSQNLPGAGTEAGDAAREALDRAEGAMEGAEDALRENDLAGAIDNQSEAMEALREGMRNLGEAMAQQQQQGQGQQGMADGADPGQQRDPLGRNVGSNGQIGSNENLLQGEDVYRRARELLDEIRRRSGEGERPEEELEYLERLLDRF